MYGSCLEKCIMTLVDFTLLHTIFNSWFISSQPATSLEDLSLFCHQPQFEVSTIFKALPCHPDFHPQHACRNAGNCWAGCTALHKVTPRCEIPHCIYQLIKRFSSVQIDWSDAEQKRVYFSSTQQIMAVSSVSSKWNILPFIKDNSLCSLWSMTDAFLDLLHCSIDWYTISTPQLYSAKERFSRWLPRTCNSKNVSENVPIYTFFFLLNQIINLLKWRGVTKNFTSREKEPGRLCIFNWLVPQFSTLSCFS